MTHEPSSSQSRAPTLTPLEMIRIIKSIDLGAPVAELDTVLYEARRETSAFTDLFKDRVDLVPGTKGSGKTALFRLISEYSKEIMLKSQLVMLTGVEATGDPVFQAFKRRFEELTEMEFENFWRVYFVSLILEKFICNEEFEYLLRDTKDEVNQFKSKCRKAKIPEGSRGRSFREIVEAVLSCIKLKFGNAEQSEEGMSYSAVEIEPVRSVPEGNEQPKDGPVFLNDIHDGIVAVLRKSNWRI